MPLVPWILLHALLVDQSHFFSPPVNWDIPIQPGLVVNYWKWLGEHFHQLLQYPWMNPIQPCRLTNIQNVEEVAYSFLLDYRSFQLHRPGTLRTIGLANKKQGKKCIKYLSLFCIFPHSISPHIQQKMKILLFLLLMYL